MAGDQASLLACCVCPCLPASVAGEAQGPVPLAERGHFWGGVPRDGPSPAPASSQVSPLHRGPAGSLGREPGPGACGVVSGLEITPGLGGRDLPGGPGDSQRENTRVTWGTWAGLHSQSSGSDCDARREPSGAAGAGAPRRREGAQEAPGVGRPADTGGAPGEVSRAGRTKDSRGAARGQIRIQQDSWPDRCRGVSRQLQCPEPGGNPRGPQEGPGAKVSLPQPQGSPSGSHVRVCVVSPPAPPPPTPPPWKLLMGGPPPAPWPHLQPQRHLFLILEAGVAEEPCLF